MGLVQAVTSETKNLAAATGVGVGMFGLSQLARRLPSVPNLRGSGLDTLSFQISRFLTETGPNPDLALYTALSIATFGGYVKGTRGFLAATAATSIPYIINKLDSIPFTGQISPSFNYLNDEANRQGTYSTGTILGIVVTGFIIGAAARKTRDIVTGKK
jgi:hypothetical protein